MADLLTETLIPLCDVAARYPARDGKRKHVGVVRRWGRDGVAGVVLEIVQLAGLWYTSEEALRRFHLAVAAARRKRGPVGIALKGMRLRSEDRRRKDHDAAAAFNRKVRFRAARA